MLATIDRQLAADAVAMGQVASIIVSNCSDESADHELARRRAAIAARDWNALARDSRWLATKDEIVWWLVTRADGSAVLVETEDNYDYMLPDGARKVWSLSDENHERLAHLVKSSVRLVPPFEPGLLGRLMRRFRAGVSDGVS